MRAGCVLSRVVRVGIVVVLLSALGGPARAGNAPCQPGTASATGIEPCTPCSAGYFQPNAGATSCPGCAVGTYQPDAGQTTCFACPANSAATSPGTAVCVPCGCDDEVACTRDACDPTTAACSATPVPSCSVHTITLAGTVTALDPATLPGPSSCVELGDALSMSFDVDPEAPDVTYPHASNQASYAVGSVELRVGAPGAEIVATAPVGSEYILNDLFGDSLILTADTGLGHATPITCAAPFQIVFSGIDDTGATLTSDAQILDGAGLLAFPDASAELLYLDASEVESWAIRSTDLQVAPEPGVLGAALSAAGGLAALSRVRARSSRLRRA